MCCYCMVSLLPFSEIPAANGLFRYGLADMGAASLASEKRRMADSNATGQASANSEGQSN